MRRLSFSVAIAFLILSFCSCQKEIADYGSTNPDSTSDNNSFLVKRYVEDVSTTAAPTQHSIDSFLLAYDSKGRILTFVSAVSPGDKFIYAYSTQSFTLDLYSSNTISLHEIFYLANNHVDSSLQDDMEGDTITEKYHYNTLGQPTRIDEYDYTKAGGAVPSDTTIYSYDGNNDLTSTSSSLGISRYTYISQIVNSLDMGMNYYYKSSAHLPDAETFILGNNSIRGTHTYTFDSKKRLTADNLVQDNGYIVEKRYYY